MHVVIANGGKQYRVAQNELVDIDLCAGKEGEKITFSEILAVGEGSNIKVGNPTIKNASVEAEIIKHYRGEKIIAFKIKRRKGYRKTKGHRQELTRVKITAIKA